MNKGIIQCDMLHEQVSSYIISSHLITYNTYVHLLIYTTHNLYTFM
jgi:hypothetical protein